MNGNLPNPRVAYQQPLHFAIPIELGGTIVSEWIEELSVPNGFLLWQQGLWVAEKSPSVFLGIPGYKCRIEDLEGDSDSEQWEIKGKIICDWKQIGELETFLSM